MSETKLGDVRGVAYLAFGDSINAWGVSRLIARLATVLPGLIVVSPRKTELVLSDLSTATIVHRDCSELIVRCDILLAYGIDTVGHSDRAHDEINTALLEQIAVYTIPTLFRDGQCRELLPSFGGE